MIAFFIPLLLFIWLFQKITKRSGIIAFLIFAIFSAMLLKASFHGLSVAEWMASFSDKWSIPLLGILVVAVVENYFARTIFSPHDWKAAWIFGAVASFVLYPSALGLGRFDTYTLGWHAGLLILIVAMAAMILIWKKNRFGILLLLALALWNLPLQASTNFWDYLIDPFYGIISIVMVLKAIGCRSSDHR